MAYESAVHYWGNFHARNLLFIRVAPDPGALEQGQNELSLIADALERDWPAQDLKAKLKDV